MRLKISYNYIEIFFLILALTPVYVGALSVNYFFVIIPIISLNCKIKLSRSYIIYLFSFIILYAFSIFIESFFGSLYYIDRSLVSFLLFISPITWGSFSTNNNFKSNFIKAIVFFSIIQSLYMIIISIYQLLIVGLTDTYLLKDIVGSSRISFILIMGYFLAFLFIKKSNHLTIVKTIIFFAIVLTFSRAAIITFLISKVLEFFLFKKTIKLSSLIVFIIILFTILYAIPATQEILMFFYERIIGRLTDSNYDATSYATSEGIRLETWRNMFSYLMDENKLILGNNYIGPWVLNNIQVSSSHNQFIDILFRSGIIGFTLIYFVIFLTLKRLYILSNIFFIVVFVLLFYGLFHESFKETQGAMILAFVYLIYFNKFGVKNLHKLCHGQNKLNNIL